MDKVKNYLIMLFLSAQAGFNYANCHIFTFWLIAFTMVVMGALVFEFKSVFTEKKDVTDYRRLWNDTKKINQYDLQELQKQVDYYKSIVSKTTGQLTQKEYDHAREIWIEEQKSKNKNKKQNGD